jgi:hypothetical protein
MNNIFKVFATLTRKNTIMQNYIGSQQYIVLKSTVFNNFTASDAISAPRKLIKKIYLNEILKKYLN